MPGSEAAATQIPREFVTGHAEKWPDPGAPSRRHPGQSRWPASAQQPQQDGLGLVIGMVTEHDHHGTRLGRELTERGTARRPGPGLRALRTELEPSHAKWQTTLHRSRGYVGRHAGALGRDAMIDMPNQQFTAVDCGTLVQQFE